VTATGLAARSYAWNGNDAIVSYQGGNFLLRTVYGPGENEPLYQLDNQGRRTWFSHDERGSTIAASIDASGSAPLRYAYDEYGNASSPAYQHGYTGALHLRTTGLYYMRARIYDPKLGRFLQPDPIGYGDGMNMYAYTGGDPVNRRDPSGLTMDIIVTGKRVESSGPVIGTFGFGFGNGAPTGSREGESSDDIVVTGRRLRRGINGKAAEAPSGARSPGEQQQRATCQNPYFRSVLSDPEVAQAMARARIQAENHVTRSGRSKYAEYGFWVSREDSGGYAPWGIFTDGLEAGIFPMRHRPGWLRSWWYDRSVAEMIIHMHRWLPLSDDDIGLANEESIAIVAATRSGEVYCHDGR
jgi:RHS repeat-associated protein